MKKIENFIDIVKTCIDLIKIFNKHKKEIFVILTDLYPFLPYKFKIIIDIMKEYAIYDDNQKIIDFDYEKAKNELFAIFNEEFSKNKKEEKLINAVAKSLDIYCIDVVEKIKSEKENSTLNNSIRKTMKRIDNIVKSINSIIK